MQLNFSYMQSQTCMKTQLDSKSLNRRKTQLENFRQYLAGLIDGDGFFYIDSQNRPQFEITMESCDEHVLQIIKQQFPGSLKPRSGANAIRLRLTQKQTLRALVGFVNGAIRLPLRQKQLQKLCKFYEIPFQAPERLLPNSPYLAGLFDSDGCISISVSKTTKELSVLKGIYGKVHRLSYSRGHNQLRCRITSRWEGFLEEIIEVYGFGRIYVENSKPNKKYHWTCQTRQELEAFLSYTQRVPLRSVKRHQCFLIERYWELRAKKAHLGPQSGNSDIGFKAWHSFCQKWYKARLKI